MSFAPGWSASVNGRPAPLHADALGLMVVEPHASGPTRIEFTYDDARELRFTGLAQAIGVLLVLGGLIARG